MSATSKNSPKRVRFETTVPTAAIAPSTAAETAAATAATSLPITLYPCAIDVAKTIIKAYRSLLEQKKVLNNVADGPAVPRSARVKFSLATQRRFEEDAAFEALQAKADDEVSRHQEAIKGVIVEKIKFETGKTEEEAVAVAVKSAYRLTEMPCIAQGVSDNLQKSMTKAAVELVFANEDIKSIVGTDATALIDAHSTAIAVTFTPQSHLETVNEFATHVRDVLVCPIETLREKDSENQLISRIRSIAMADSVEGATAATAVAVDAEPTAAPDTVRDEVRKQVEEMTKTLHNKLNQLTQVLKNDTEGPTPSASRKKKKGNENESKNQGRADDDNNASRPDKSKKKRGKNNKKSAGTRQTSKGDSGN